MIKYTWLLVFTFSFFLNTYFLPPGQNYGDASQYLMQSKAIFNKPQLEKIYEENKLLMDSHKVSIIGKTGFVLS